MLKDVVYDLRVFLLFYSVLIVLFAMTFAVLGLGNENFYGKFRSFYVESRKNAIKDESEKDGYDSKNDDAIVFEYPGSEYKIIGKFAGYIVTTLRVSMGDNSFESCQFLNDEENFIFWFLWLLMTFLTFLIFLNFVIAETGKSYNAVDERLAATIAKEQAALTAEAEMMMPIGFKDDASFPKYILIRQSEH